MIGSHIIPRFYLEQFSTPSELRKKGGKRVKSGRVWVYEKSKDPKLRSTSRQGRENGYFGFILPNGRLNEFFEGTFRSAAMTIRLLDSFGSPAQE
jgi:Protein of unknown function (DUF4238)